MWSGPQVADMVDDNEDLMRRWRKLADPQVRDPRQDELATQALLALSSDWAFMVSKDSAAQYARLRHAEHHRQFASIAAAIETGRPVTCGNDRSHIWTRGSSDARPAPDVGYPPVVYGGLGRHVHALSGW